MTEDEARSKLIALWLEHSEDAIASAELELEAGHPNFALNRVYYACFYAVTALLFKDGKQFGRHSGVRSEFHKSYVKTGLVETRWGRFYQDLFEDRQQGDYVATASFDVTGISGRLEQAREFVRIVRGLVNS